MTVELINEVGVDCQIADKGMAFDEGEDLLLRLLADQTPNILKAVGTGFKRLGTGGVDCASRVTIDEPAQAHNGA
jgi:peroxiredoxin